MWIGPWVNRNRKIFINGEEQPDHSLNYNHLVLTKEQIDRLNEIKFKWVANYSRIYRKEITNSISYSGIKRYLEEELNRLIEEENMVEVTKENISVLQKKFKFELDKKR